MTSIDTRSALLALALAGGIGAGAAFASAGSDGLRCEIRQGSVFGMSALEAVVEADNHLSGTYSFTVTGAGGGGGTDIRQGGAFSVSPGSPVTLGKVGVGGGSYEARLTVKAGAMSADCEDSFGTI